MAKRKKKAAEPEDKATEQPQETIAPVKQQDIAEQKAPEHKPKEKLRTIETAVLPGVNAHLIDDFHAVGVKFDFQNQEDRPSKEVTAVLKDHGFSWNLERQQWRKRLSRETPGPERADAQEGFAEAVTRLRKEREGNQR